VESITYKTNHTTQMTLGNTHRPEQSHPKEQMPGPLSAPNLTDPK